MRSVEEVVLKVINYPLDTEVDDSFGIENCEDWDSMAQIQLVVEVEDEFGVEINTDEAMNMDTIGGIKSILREKGITVD